MRVPTSHSTIRISPLTHACIDVMSCRSLNRTIVEPPLCSLHTAKPSRAPMPSTHKLAAATPARTKALPSRTRTCVVSPPATPSTMPSTANAPISSRSLPPVGIGSRYVYATKLVIPIGKSRKNASMRLQRICRSDDEDERDVKDPIGLDHASTIARTCADVINPRVEPRLNHGGGRVEIRAEAKVAYTHAPTQAQAQSRAQPNPDPRGTPLAPTQPTHAPPGTARTGIS